MTENDIQDPKKIQEMFMEYQMLEQRKQQVLKQLVMLQEQLKELETVINNLEEIKSVGKGSDLIIPLANGIFAKAKMEDAKNLIVNVGSGVAVEKDVDGVKELLKKQVEEIKNIYQEMDIDLRNSDLRAIRIAEKIQKSNPQ